MVNVCVVYGCHNRSSKEVKRSFHAIPAVLTTQGEKTERLSAERRRLWISKIARKDWTPTKHSKVCSDHFVEGKPTALYNQNHPDWAPSLKLGLIRDDKPSTSSPVSLERYSRAADRQNKRARYSAAETLLDLADPVFSVRQFEDSHADDEKARKVCTFHLQGKLEQRSEKHNVNVQQIREDHQNLTTENMNLRQKIQDQSLTLESLKDNDEKVKYYTGLPRYITLVGLFHLLDPYISGNGRSVLANFQKVLMVLMKLRLGLNTQDLAYRFGVSASTVSRTFGHVINVMYCRMKDMIMWPDREQLRSTMPMEFRKNFGLKVAVIIDCFEIFTERPSDLLARAETWSNYKHHNTIKLLIGITPQGVVSYLSSAWGGRASDKMITESCDLLDRLLPGDLVLADRGFDIAESVGLQCAEVKIPAFTKGRKQLSPLEVQETRKIAHVRIHVERVIGLVRNKYTILKGTLPMDYMQNDEDEVPLIDKIVTVCCALTNLCASVIPFN